MGCFEVGLGDTVDVGVPTTVGSLLRVLLSEIAPERVAGHFHDTYGQAVANVAKAYGMGSRAFNSSVAGLRGCPYAKGAKGNLATQDMVYTFEQSGVNTGVDLAKLADAGDWISKTLRLPNSSRAGAAIVAKGQQGVFAKISETKISQSSNRWVTVSDSSDYRVSQLGNDMKITLTRPNNGNAMTNAMVEDITRTFRTAATDPTIFHIVVEIDGKYFFTGVDMSSSADSGSNSTEANAEYYGRIAGLFNGIEDAPQTTISVVNGPCFGGGVGLAFACDIRLASANARYTLSEIKLGVVLTTSSWSANGALAFFGKPCLLDVT